MSAPARHLQAVAPPAGPGPALVPMVGDRAPRIEPSPGSVRPVNAHRLFYGLWYVALGVFAASAWIGRLHYQPSIVLNLLGALFVALGGFGILVHTLWKPNERKLRHALAAVAALALTIAAAGPLRHVSTQVYATSRVARLQPLADVLARDGRIRNVGLAGMNLRLNGFHGHVSGDEGWLEGHGQPATTLPEVLKRDGLTRTEVQPYLDGLRRAGMRDAERTSTTVLFTPARTYDTRLLYVAPGHPLPDLRRVMNDRSTWRSEPLGGGWYLLLGD